MIIIIIGLGILVLGIIFVPEFIVGLMRLSVIAAVAYIITSQFMKKEISYLIIVLYLFAALTSFVQLLTPKFDSIKGNVEKLQKIDRGIETIR